jgi:hypothetical protein
MEDFFSKTGPLPPVYHDARRFARFYFRTCAEALIYPPGENQSPTRHFLLTRDLSRGGVGLLHSEQLLPGQRLDLLLDGKPPLTAVVVWCRRVSDRCYALGCRFEKESDPAKRG